jgi:hypothetical protein
MTRYSKTRLPVTNGRPLQEFESTRPARHLDARFEIAALRKCCNLSQAQLNPIRPVNKYPAGSPDARRQPNKSGPRLDT